MEVQSQNDDTSINDDLTIRFPEGLLGFEEYPEFHLFSSEKERGLYWLQPIDNEQIEFAVTFPGTFRVEYEVFLDEHEEKLLGIEDNDEIVVLVTLSKNQADESTTGHLNANFIAPIVINVSKKLGLQKVLSQQENPVTITMRG
jgi:flagellar assembly factor FliW